MSDDEARAVIMSDLKYIRDRLDIYCPKVDITIERLDKHLSDGKNKIDDAFKEKQIILMTIMALIAFSSIALVVIEKIIN